jgi:hypothetical protein
VADFYPAASTDDSHIRHYLSVKVLTSDSAVIKFGNDGGDAYHLYLRFPNVTIPQGATITSAVLEVVAKAPYTQTSTGVKTNIYANDVNDSSAPADGTAYLELGLTSAVVAWDISSTWQPSTAYQSPDLTSVIQEIVDREGWSSGNALALCVMNNSSSYSHYREVNAFDNESSYPKLTITYDTSIQGSIDDSFTVHAAMDAWKTPDELAEGFTVNASMKAGFEIQGAISEDLTVNAAMDAEREVPGSISENLTVNAAFDAIATYNRGLAASASVADSIDALATYNRGLASAVSLGAVMDAEFKWPVKRQVFPYRAQGKRLSIKIGCAEKGSWIKLLDISTTVLPMVGRTRSQAVKLKGTGNHIGVKISNTSGATLKLAYVGLQIERPIGR